MKKVQVSIFKPCHVLGHFLLKPLLLSASLLVLFFLGTGQSAFGAFGASATLSWKANTEPDLAGYNLYYGTETGSYGPPIRLGLQTSHTITDLSNGTYYFALTAYDAGGNESEYSAEVNKLFSEFALGSHENTLLFHAIAGNREVTLSWKNPSHFGFAGIRIIYRTDRFPKKIDDGEFLMDIDGPPGKVMSVLQTGLLNEVTYYFLAASYDENGNFYLPATDSAKIGIVRENQNSVSKDEPGGGCGMVLPKGGNTSGPGGHAGMLSLIGIMVLMLLRARLKSAMILIKGCLQANLR